jgi:membrane-associated protein
VTLFIWGGYLFGNVPLVKQNFGLVTIGIVVVSVLPVVWGLLKKE